MLRKKIKEISNYLEILGDKENQAKMNLYMKKGAQYNLKSVENERTEFYKSIICPFVSKYRKELNNEEEDISAVMRYLDNKCTSFYYIKNPELVEISEKIIQNSMNFSFSLNGKIANRADNINVLLSNNNAELRKSAWNSFVFLGEENTNLYCRLFYLRKQFVDKLNSSNLFQWKMKNYQLQDMLLPVNEIAIIVREKLEKILYNKYNIKLSNIYPWDLKYFCLANKDNEGFNRNIKIRNFKDILENVVNKSNYNLSDLNIGIFKADIPYDGLCIGWFSKKANILFNPRESFESLTYFFHEFGHAFQTVRQQSDCYILSKAEAGLFYEGVAYCFERIAVNDKFIEEELGLKGAESLYLIEQAKLRQLYDIIMVLVNIEFERKIYKHNVNINEINHIYANIYENIVGIEHPRNAYWASSVYYAREIYPFLDYLLAEMIVEQTMPYIYNDTNYNNYTSIISLLDKHYILPNTNANWNFKIKNLTDSILSPKILINHIKN